MSSPFTRVAVHVLRWLKDAELAIIEVKRCVCGLARAAPLPLCCQPNQQSTMLLGDIFSYHVDL